MRPILICVAIALSTAHDSRALARLACLEVVIDAAKNAICEQPKEDM